MKQIPNLFTLLNLFFGCIAVIFTLQNGIAIMYGSDGAQLADIPEKIWLASLFVGLAGIVDFLDGFLARLMKASSAMGKQLDSLADVVSFGVVPGMIIYQFLRMSFIKDKDGLEASFIFLLPALILPCAAAYRLARFNLDDSQSTGFRGIPVPAVGLLIASFPLIYWTSTSVALVGLLLNKWFLYALVLLLSWGMVSNLPIMAFKFKDYSLQNNWPRYLVVLLAVLSALLFGWLAVPIAFVLYIVLSLLFKEKIK